MGKVLAVTNRKGGTGKTMTSVSLGVSLVRQGKKVLLIDADSLSRLRDKLSNAEKNIIPTYERRWS